MDALESAKENHGPLEAYQWSAVKLAQQVQFVKRMLIAFGAVLLTALIIILVWAAASFGSELNTVRSQQQSYHQDSVVSSSLLQCETKALDQILTELAASQQAQAAHETEPAFVYPKPC